MTDDTLTAAVARLREEVSHCAAHNDAAAVTRSADLRLVLAALEAAQADAARYRWLRNTRRLYLGPVINFGAQRNREGARCILAVSALGVVPRNTETLDAAIDAAIKGECRV